MHVSITSHRNSPLYPDLCCDTQSSSVLHIFFALPCHGEGYLQGEPPSSSLWVYWMTGLAVGHVHMPQSPNISITHGSKGPPDFIIGSECPLKWGLLVIEEWWEKWHKLHQWSSWWSLNSVSYSFHIYINGDTELGSWHLWRWNKGYLLPDYWVQLIMVNSKK